MLMSVIEGALSVPAYPELAGKRVLVTGLTSSCGVDIARAFAEHRGRLVLQFAEASAAMETVAEIVAPDALEAKGMDHRQRSRRRRAVRQDGDEGLWRPRRGDQPGAARNAGGQSDCHSGRRGAAGCYATDFPFLISKIAANRMSMVWNEGLILNVATLGRKARGPAQAFAAVAKAGLTAMTRAQAEEWAGRAVRFNAIAPELGLVPGGQGLSGEPDIAAMALYLASGRGRELSGHVFEAAVA